MLLCRRPFGGTTAGRPSKNSKAPGDECSDFTVSKICLSGGRSRRGDRSRKRGAKFAGGAPEASSGAAGPADGWCSDGSDEAVSDEGALGPPFVEFWVAIHIYEYVYTYIER